MPSSLRRAVSDHRHHPTGSWPSDCQQPILGCRFPFSHSPHPLSRLPPHRTSQELPFRPPGQHHQPRSLHQRVQLLIVRRVELPQPPERRLRGLHGGCTVGARRVHGGCTTGGCTVGVRGGCAPAWRADPSACSGRARAAPAGAGGAPTQRSRTTRRRLRVTGWVGVGCRAEVRGWIAARRGWREGAAAAARLRGCSGSRGELAGACDEVNLSPSLRG